MTAFVDANIFVRHLTGDPGDMAARATAFLATQRQLLLTDLTVAELVYVLESFYEAPRKQVAVCVRAVLMYPSVVCVDVDDVLLRSLEVYETERFDFPQAYLLACAESSGVTRVASFDESLDRFETIERVEPA